MAAFRVFLERPMNLHMVKAFVIGMTLLSTEHNKQGDPMSKFSSLIVIVQ